MEDKKIGIPLEGFGEAVRKAAAEGMVLLKNENQMLPITEKDQVALFGREPGPVSHGFKRKCPFPWNWQKKPERLPIRLW